MQLKYRAEINGLRGISVIAVVFYHAQFLIFGKDFFQGGFLGVDIFFVISGYLITSIILDEYYKYGKFSFKNFYLRRARRLLPALLVISFVSLIIGFAVLYPVAMKEFSNSVLASLLFVSNYFFHFEGQNYGADNSILQPFLHTWSLSVEEQFYIFFPIIIFICLRKFNDKLNFLLLLGFIISFFLCMIANQLYTSINFYSFPTRGWELLSGSILANLERKNYNFKFIHLSNKLSLLGLFLIIFSFLYFDFNNFSHPSLLTIIPVFGTMLIIWFCRDDNSFTGKILKNKYLVGVGLISYSLYLWHFPILSFLEISNLKVFTYHKIIFILVSIFLSIITYLYVEKPFRNAKIINSKNFLKLIFSMSGIILLFFLIYPKYHVEKYPSIYKDLGGKTWYTTRQFFKPCFQRKDYFCTFNNSSSNLDNQNNIEKKTESIIEKESVIKTEDIEVETK